MKLMFLLASSTLALRACNSTSQELGDSMSASSATAVCLSVCDKPAYTCNNGETPRTGNLDFLAKTATGCTWSFATPGQPTAELTMVCSPLSQPCMLEDGVCGALNWAAPGDMEASAVGFGTPGESWGCSAP
jgi:hypothetical protein